MFETGTVIDGSYLLEEKIYSGPLADVWKARSSQRQKDVALKVLGGALYRDRDFMVGFKEEVARGMILDHPNVLSVLEERLGSEPPYFVMAYVKDGTLKDRLDELKKRGDHMPLDEVKTMANGVLEALSYAHNRVHHVDPFNDKSPELQGFVHQDMKPSNILIECDSQGHLTKALLMDFGLSRAWGRANGATQQVKIQSTGGSPQYFSPDLIEGQDARSDLYSFGVVLFECLTNSLPLSPKVENPSIQDWFLCHKNVAPLAVRSLRPDLPAGMDGFFRKALEKDPKFRFQTADQMKEAFASALAGRAIADPSQVETKPPEVVSEALKAVPQAVEEPQSAVVQPVAMPPQPTKPRTRIYVQGGCGATIAVGAVLAFAFIKPMGGIPGAARQNQQTIQSKSTDPGSNLSAIAPTPSSGGEKAVEVKGEAGGTEREFKANLEASDLVLYNFPVGTVMAPPSWVAASSSPGRLYKDEKKMLGITVTLDTKHGSSPIPNAPKLLDQALDGEKKRKSDDKEEGLQDVFGDPTDDGFSGRQARVMNYTERVHDGPLKQIKTYAVLVRSGKDYEPCYIAIIMPQDVTQAEKLELNRIVSSWKWTDGAN